MGYTNLLTIAIPVFERINFFMEALESALNQTVRCKIIVVDNCSSHDFFEKTCEKYEIEYYRNQKNIGMFPNWNRCFALCDTEFVMLLGDDDILYKNYVASFIKAQEKYDDIDIFFCDFEILDNKTKQIHNHKHILPFGYMSNGEKIIEYGIKHRLGFPIITSAIKRVKFNGFYEDFHASNDWVWLYENINRLVVYGDFQKLLIYRSHANNDSKNLNTRINTHISIWFLYKDILYNYLKKKNDKTLHHILRDNIKHTMFYVMSHIKKEYFNKIIELNNRYSYFLKNEYNSKLYLKIWIAFPLFLRIFCYKILRKLKFIR